MASSREQERLARKYYREHKNYRERKINDMTQRLDGLYDSIVEVEQLIAEATLKRNGIEEDAISLQNIYEILKTFGEIYDIIDDKERKTIINMLVKTVEIYANDEGAVRPLKAIEFSFPMYKNGELVKRVVWEARPKVETLVQLSHKKPDTNLEVALDFEDEGVEQSLAELETLV